MGHVEIMLRHERHFINQEQTTFTEKVSFLILYRFSIEAVPVASHTSISSFCRTLFRTLRLLLRRSNSTMTLALYSARSESYSKSPPTLGSVTDGGATSRNEPEVGDSFTGTGISVFSPHPFFPLSHILSKVKFFSLPLGVNKFHRCHPPP